MRPRISPYLAKIALLVVSTLLSLAIGEVMSRTYWKLQHVPLRRPDLVLLAFYPELGLVEGRRPSHADQFYDVLLLGASTLSPDWGTIEQSLREQLVRRGVRDVRVFNFGVAAHTSRDSWLKYASLVEERFELIVFYDGLNEARANNIPPELFQEDYSHYTWYETVNTLAPYHRATSYALPYTLRYLSLQMVQMVREDRYLPRHTPREDWLQYGREPRSAKSFERNLTAIADLAASRRDRLMVMTFALHVPENYSLEAFREKRLDYRLHLEPIEVWGQREHVVAAVDAHNDIVRRLVARYPDTLFVDQAQLMRRTADYFNDPCHFTVAGSEQFVENLLTVLEPTLKRQ